MKKQLLLACLTLLVFSRPMQAEPPRAASPSDAETPAEERQRSEFGNAQQRRKLRDELESYSRKAYPDQDNVDRRRRMMHDRMQERLSNSQSGNISISRSEAQLRMPKLARHFDQIDSSGNGEITMDEINAWREQLGSPKAKSADGDADTGTSGIENN